MWVQLSIHTLYICEYILYFYSDICTDIGEFSDGGVRMCQHLRGGGGGGGHYWKLFLGVVVLVLPAWLACLFAFGADLCFSISDL